MVTTGCLQPLEISWNLKLLLEILETSWNVVDSSGKFYSYQCNFRTSGFLVGKSLGLLFVS